MSTQFDRPMAGFRFALTRVGDTLQAIALRELGDAARWPELISYNDLVPPFLVDDPSLAARGVLVTGSALLVPAATMAAQQTDPDAVYGTDVALDKYGRVSVTADGDFDTVSGLPNLKQAISHRLDTERLELIFHPDYGGDARRLIGLVNGPTRGLVGARAARATVEKDPRVARVQKARADVAADVINISVEFETVTGHTTDATTQV